MAFERLYMRIDKRSDGLIAGAILRVTTLRLGKGIDAEPYNIAAFAFDIGRIGVRAP